MKDRLESVEHLGADAKRLRERLGARRNEHELLEVEPVLRVYAAVDHVHQRHRQRASLVAAEPAEERHAGVRGGRLRGGERAAEDRVRSEPALGRRAVELDQGSIERALVVGVEPDDRVRDLAVDVARPPASTPLPRYAAGSPSRSSTASCSPVEAPDGTAARPRAPDSSRRRPRRVGFPRESRSWRAWTWAIAVMRATPSRARSRRPAHRGRGLASPRRGAGELGGQLDASP